MLSRFMPKEGKFFELFRESASQIVLGSQELRSMLVEMSPGSGTASSQAIESRSRTIKGIEHKADEITHRTIEMLHTTFITPIDREDIHELITKMDDIMDFMEATSQRIFLYDIKESTPEARGLIEICVASAQAVQRAVA